MKKWKCLICGEIVESETAPVACPVCKAPAEKFVELKDEELTWAAEHVVGVAKDVPEEIKEGLRANFNGECTEVGMYLAMARVAAREGYPEVALYWEKAAYEEAVEASKLAQEKSKAVNELIDKFVRDYGSYHATFDKAPELYSPTWDLLFNRFIPF